MTGRGVRKSRGRCAGGQVPDQDVVVAAASTARLVARPGLNADRVHQFVAPVSGAARTGRRISG